MHAVVEHAVDEIIDGLDAAWDANIAKGAVSAGEAGLRVRLAHCGVSRADLAALSTAFLEERRAQAKRVLGPSPYNDAEVQFLFLPIPGSVAAVYPLRDSFAVVVSLGLVEALRLCSIAGRLQSALERIEHSAKVESALGEERFRYVCQLFKRMCAFINASAVLCHLDGGKVPNFASRLDAATRHRADVLLEAGLMFVLLHELGHVRYRRALLERGVNADDVQWEFTVPENLDERKTEELFADRFALDAVSHNFRLTLTHASCLLLQLYTCVDTLQHRNKREHPLSVNRLQAMQSYAGVAQGYDVGQTALNAAIKFGERLWKDSAAGSAKTGLDALKRFVGAHSQFDWRPISDALLILDARQEGDDARAGNHA
ncbi:hypothetical protein [Caballeronia sp. GAWG1-1]|uniref:hypothetical protein n=1 Tax=Caballeronia sp. GAWG1-1 TaxID=2921742 RepID=UPI00202869E7|nr:hypothetical protein [Caballeronia sp. GAWG1-1]